MHLVVINGNRTRAHSHLIAAAVAEQVSAGTTVEVLESPDAPASVESFTAVHLSAVATLQLVARVARADAIVIACFSDPGLYAARELAAVPVVGTAEAAMHLACLVSQRFSILIGADDRHALVNDVVRRHGFSERCASIRTIGVPVLATHADAGDTMSRLVEAGQRALRDDRAEALCLGCAAYTGMARDLTAALGVPVLDGVTCAVKLAEALVSLGLRTSRAGAFPRAALDGQLVLH